MKVHISEGRRAPSSNRWIARYARLGTTRVVIEQHEDPISLNDVTYRMVLNCLTKSDSKDMTTNGRCESVKRQSLNTKEEVKP